MGAHTDDIIRQNNARAMNQMGYKPPVVPPTDPLERHQFVLNQAKQTNSSKSQHQIHMVNALLSENLPSFQNAEEVQRYEKTKYYRQALAELIAMHLGDKPFSLKRAVFIVENAWHDNALAYNKYLKSISIKTTLLKGIMAEEGFSENNHLGKNYAIQLMFSQRIVEYRDTIVRQIHMPYSYDFEDFYGEQDWSKMFVTKLLKTGKGQCHSLPLLYLILAEELKVKAWLSLAPEHSFIIFGDPEKHLYFNYETTNGSCVSDNWLMESGYISSMAISNGIFLDTLGRNGLMATILADLIMGYTNKFGYDNFVEKTVNTLLKIHPKSIQGHIIKSDLILLQTKKQIVAAGNPPLEQLPKYPTAHEQYKALMQQYDLIDRSGYMGMPKEKYEQWLELLDDEKHKQDKQRINTMVFRNAKSNN